MVSFIFSLILLLNPMSVHADVSVSPSLFFSRSHPGGTFAAKSLSFDSGYVPVTLRFTDPPSETDLFSYERYGIVFFRDSGRILHSMHIYPAKIDPDSLETIRAIPGLECIENSNRPAVTNTLDVSNTQVQASEIWNLSGALRSYTGKGVTVVDADTGIDIYHPAFFKDDGGAYSWIDINSNHTFDSGIDGVDLDADGLLDSNEVLRFYDAPCKDSLSLLARTAQVFDADFDWLYNDSNNNQKRDYGPDNGFSEQSPCYGERVFLVRDLNGNNRLDPGEPLTSLGTSKVKAIFDKNGKHLRGENLLSTTGDTLNHGTAALGVVGGQHPGRRLTGMAPGAEFIAINRGEVTLEECLLQARDLGANIFMYEFGSWVYEPLDGSSNMEVLIDDLYSEGFHQFTASGNLAGPTRQRHAFTTLASSGQDSLLVTVPPIGIKELYFSFLWRGKLSPSNRPVISLLLPNGQSAPINGDQIKRTFGIYTIVSGYDYSSLGTARFDVLVTSPDTFSGNYTISLRNRRTTELSLHGYLADDATQWMNGSRFTNHVTDDGTICSPGTSIKGITVGAYDPRGTRNRMGDINDFSSWGKTIDGRIGVDITAPGTLVYSLLSSTDSNVTPGGYFEFGGTSAALPHVAGCAALLLEAKPGFSPDELVDALELYALQDSFTGTVPNDIWGYGKLRMRNVFSGLNLNTSVETTNKPVSFSVSEGQPNPFNSEVTFQILTPSGPNSNLEISVYNSLGQRILFKTYSTPLRSFHFSWNGKSLTGSQSASGLYFVQFRMSGSLITKKILFLR